MDGNWEQFLDELAREWQENWNASKGKITRKLRNPYYQVKWKRETLSPKAIKERRENLIKAINAGLIEQGLAEVDPAEWASDTVKGIENTTVTETEAQEWKNKAGDYIKFVMQKKAEFDRLGLTGKEAMDWWYNNVSKVMKEKKYRQREAVYSRASEQLVIPLE